jgi:hypothetical protein
VRFGRDPLGERVDPQAQAEIERHRAVLDHEVVVTRPTVGDRGASVERLEPAQDAIVCRAGPSEPHLVARAELAELPALFGGHGCWAYEPA